MSVHVADHLMRQIRCDDPITRIIISDDEVMKVNPDSAWEVDRIYTDYAPWNEHKELIVVFRRKETDHDV